jgi:hypothetical protein
MDLRLGSVAKTTGNNKEYNNLSVLFRTALKRLPEEPTTTSRQTRKETATMK